MQDNNVIYELSKQIQNKEVMQNDMKEALGLVANLFKSKYIDKINLELKNHIKNIEDNPTKEIVLLNAIKPFVLEENQKNIDNMINIVTNISALSHILPKSLNTENKVIKINALDPSVKKDGVYDIDESCLTHINSSFDKPNNILMLAMFLLLFNL